MVIHRTLFILAAVLTAPPANAQDAHLFTPAERRLMRTLLKRDLQGESKVLSDATAWPAERFRSMFEIGASSIRPGGKA
jgi:hypothetical protein